MAVDVTSVVEIELPRQDVAAFLENPANDNQWIRALVRPPDVLTSTPYGVGTRVRRVAKMAAATIDYTTEVVEYEPAARVVMKTVSGPGMIVTYTLRDLGGSRTEVSVRNQSDGGVLFKLFGSLMGRMVRSRVDGDLEQLKSVLEKSTPPGP